MSKRRSPLARAAARQAAEPVAPEPASDDAAACAICGVVGQPLMRLDTPGRTGVPTCQDCMESAMSIAVPDGRQLTLIRMEAGKIHIKYEICDGSDKIEGGLKSEDAPRLSFGRALQRLAPHAAAICELPDAWAKNVIATGLKVDYTDAGIIATLICIKPLESGAVMGFSTPPTHQYSERGATLTKAALEDITTLRAEAFAYLNGNRAQGSLFQEQ